MFSGHRLVHRRPALVRRALLDTPIGTTSSNANANSANANTPAAAAASLASSVADGVKTSAAAVTTNLKTMANPDTPTSTTAASSSSPAPASSAASSSAPSSAPTSSASNASSAVAATLAASSASVAAPASTYHLGTTVVTGVSYNPTSSPAASSTSTTSTSTGSNTSVLVGGIAGTLVGIAVLGFLLMWCMRRQRNRDLDDFDASAFRRQSAMLVDDPVEPPRSYNPRPPSMIEHRNVVSPALSTQAGFGSQNFYGNYGGPYGPQSHVSPDMIQPAASPPPHVYGTPPIAYAGYNDPQPDGGYPGYNSLARQPSSATYLTRQPSANVGFAPAVPPPSLVDPGARYIDLNRSSVSPFQAAQYADISRQLGSTDPNDHVLQEVDELPDGPLPSPFDDPVGETPQQSTTPVRPEHPSDAAPPAPVSVSQPKGHAAESQLRPSTVYEEGDAYGGI